MLLPDRAYPQFGITSKGDFWVETTSDEPAIRPWDVLQLGGVKLPGVWQIEASVETEFDTPKMPTKQLNPPKYIVTIHDKGYKPGQLKATGAIWTLSDWNDLRDKLPTISPKASSQLIKRAAYDIKHPAAALLGIDQVLIYSVRVRPPVNQTLFVEISMIQYFQATKVFPLYPTGGKPLGNSDASLPKAKPT